MRSIRERLEEMQPNPQPGNVLVPSGVPIDVVAPGIERVTGRGAHYLIDNAVPDPTRGELATLTRLLPSMLDHHSPIPAAIELSDILFLDTETTGLDRGTGTNAFLVGIGFFDRGIFRVEQHFLRDLHEEASLLCNVEMLIRQFPILVSFNGRGFDWPLLHSRFILHGYRDIPEMVHWDLLTSSRRVWRNRLRDCSLGNLERQILDVRRLGDVPGYLIPDLYFDYLRSRDARPLRPVFSHNLEDIVSLARLAEILLRADNDPLTSLSHPVDQLSYGLFLSGRGNHATAEALILQNIDDPTIEETLRFRAFRCLTVEFKRRDRRIEAMELHKQMLRYRWGAIEHALFPLVELAKYYEHIVRDYQSAIKYTEHALNLASIRSDTSERATLLHRYERLQRKSGSFKQAVTEMVIDRGFNE